MKVLISGGAKNGKSALAQQLAASISQAECLPLYYVATMIPADEEDRARIARHIAERQGWGFETLEQGRNLQELLEDPRIDRSGVFLLDSLTALLSNEMFQTGSRMDREAARRVAGDCTAFARAVGSAIFVSDGIYGDAQGYDAYTEAYRRGLAQIERRLAGECDRVVEVCAGWTEEWK